jgi:leucyl-tRNA synthetase
VQDEIELMLQERQAARRRPRRRRCAQGRHRSRRPRPRGVKFMEGKPAKKVVVVPGRLVNIVC